MWSLYPFVFGRGVLGGGSAGRLAPPGGVQVAWPLGSGSPHRHNCRFHAPPEPSLDRERSSVRVWDVFPGLLTDLCISGFSSHQRENSKTFFCAGWAWAT